MLFVARPVVFCVPFGSSAPRLVGWLHKELFWVPGVLLQAEDGQSGAKRKTRGFCVFGWAHWKSPVLFGTYLCRARFLGSTWGLRSHAVDLAY